MREKSREQRSSPSHHIAARPLKRLFSFSARPSGFSAHFKIDARGPARTLYNFGFGAKGALGLYDAFALSEQGKLLRKGNLPLPLTDISFVHDWCGGAGARGARRRRARPCGGNDAAA